MRTGFNTWRLARCLLPLVAMLAAPADSSLASHATGTGAAASVTLSVWTYPQDDPTLLNKEKAAFEHLHPNITVKYVILPENNYTTKVNTALQGHRPPDVAIIEDKIWMKAGKVVKLNPYLRKWDINPWQFNRGGLGRLTFRGNPNEGMYAVGDWMDGNVLVYNKKLLRDAHVAFPSPDRSMTWPQYAQVCRKVAKPNFNPTKAIYGCSVPSFAFGIWNKWLFGPDGHHAMGHMNSAAMVQAWNVGTALVRDKMAPGSSILSSLPNGEPDLFKQGRIAMTWSDFTFAKDFKANHIDFGITPFPVISGSPSFVDTWTAAWGTFTESRNKAAALEFLRFIATGAQRVVAKNSFIPPLSMTVGKAAHYGSGSPAEQQFLRVLRQAKTQLFIPPLPPGNYYDAQTDIYNKMTVRRQTDAKPLLDDAAKKNQGMLDKAWRDWAKVGT